MDRPATLAEAYRRKYAGAKPAPAAERPGLFAALDHAIELSRTDPTAFAALDPDLRRRAADRLLNLTARARREQEADQ